MTLINIKRILIFISLAILSTPSFAFNLFSLVLDQRVETYIKLRDAQDWEKALKVIREEVAKPLLSSDSYLTDIRTIAMGAVADYAEQYGLNQDLDAEAKRYYDEAVDIVEGDKQRIAQIDRAYALYQSKTGRNGRAIELVKRSLDYWITANDTYQIINGYDSLSSFYFDMGQEQLGLYYRKKALDLAQIYFQLGVKPTDPYEWKGYSDMLEKHLEMLSKTQNSSTVEPIWNLYESISRRYFKTLVQTYQKGAQIYAFANDIDRAREMLRKADQNWTVDKETLTKANAKLADLMPFDKLTATAVVDLYAGDYRKAAQSFENALSLEGKLGRNMEDFSLQNMRGLAYEHLNDFEKAKQAYRESIAIIEKHRSSFDLSQRVAYFRNISRKPYWGLLRVYANAYAQSGDPTEFSNALLSSESTRARQLGEMLDPNSELTSEAINHFRQQLTPDDVVLAYTLMDNEIVVLAFTKDQQQAVVIPYKGKQFAGDIGAAARDLANPDSNLLGLQEKLAALGKTLLNPVGGLIEGKKNILVLPDGVANLVPFDVLSMHAAPYRPLIADFTIRLAPALRILINSSTTARQSSGLLAVGDPVYAKKPGVAGLSDSELQSVTRGSRYLSYFQPLPETRLEVQKIAGLFPNSKNELLVGERASESALKSTDLGKYRYLHFATHGILGGEVPGVTEPALVLSNEPKEDGFLTASEVAAFKLNSELAVLSACNTGSGEYFTGEGVMGMSRSFLAAGSRSVLVSLWPVASEATEQLMVSFYQKLRAGKDAAEALRLAKLEMFTPKNAPAVKGKPVLARVASSEYGHPYFWSPFVLIGN